MVQMLAGLITDLLLAISCYEQHNEKVSIKRVRELCIQIQNELRANPSLKEYFSDVKEHGILDAEART